MWITSAGLGTEGLPWLLGTCPQGRKTTALSVRGLNPLQPGLTAGSRQHLKNYVHAEESEDPTGSFLKENMCVRLPMCRICRMHVSHVFLYVFICVFLCIFYVYLHISHLCIITHNIYIYRDYSTYNIRYGKCLQPFLSWHEKGGALAALEILFLRRKKRAPLAHRRAARLRPGPPLTPARVPQAGGPGAVGFVPGPETGWQVFTPQNLEMERNPAGRN